MAIVNWLFARHHQGRFLLRIDDTDTERSTAEYEQQIMRDMAWMGLTHDAFERQTARLDLYQKAFEMLKQQGKLYPCYETSAELSLKRKALLGRNAAPIYDRAGLSLSDEKIQQYEAEGRKPHWRFLLEEGVIAWNDLCRGEISFDTKNLSDPILIKENGRPLYTLSSVVDDGTLGITHVIRGADHISNTAIQIQLFQALGYDVPNFAHLPLLSDEQGKGLSKRLGSLSLSQMAEEGMQPHALVCYLSQLGTSHSANGTEKIEQLIKNFDLSYYGRADPCFSTRALKDVNSRVLHHTPFEKIQNWLSQHSLEKANAFFWETIRTNIEELNDLKIWYEICYAEIKPEIAEEDAAYLVQAANILTKIENRADYKSWIKAIVDFSGRKGRSLYMPIRRALSTKSDGPELDSLLIILGHEKAAQRLRGQTI